MSNDTGLTEQVVADYEAGESLKALAERVGVSRHRMARWLRDQGVRRRSMSEQRAIEARRLPDSMRNMRTAAANAARRRAAMRRRESDVPTVDEPTDGPEPGDDASDAGGVRGAEAPGAPAEP